ncbi:MAG: Fe-S cluster assembly protein SufD [Chloroflexi bacterium]|nr:Fe-S cluster assembly protein SufD [Chloroflexota bacterium]
MAEALATRDRYLSDFRRFEESLPPEGPQWLRQVRRQALSRFTELGFPTARKGNEKWKYTNVAPIAAAGFNIPAGVREVDVPSLRRVAPWDDSWITLAFVNGLCSSALSTGAPAGALVTNLAEATRADGHLIEQHLARYATFEDDGFTALNTAFLRDGAFVHLPPDASLPAPLHLVHVTAGGAQPIASYPRTLIVAEAGSRLTVVETYAGLSAQAYLTDTVTEIVLGEGAQVEHYRVLLENADAFHVGITRVSQGQDSTFSSTLFARGAAIGRNDFQVLLDGPGSSCFLNGLYVTTGSQHIDNYINIDHARPHTTSRLLYKGILDGKSRAIFGGTVLVRSGAVKADAKQTDKNLILSDEAEVDSKPSLEIYADDVQCGHGATAGALAEEALFYMKSRGLDEQTATALLIKGFASEILDTVQVRPLRTFLERLTLRAIPAARVGGKS